MRVHLVDRPLDRALDPGRVEPLLLALAPVRDHERRDVWLALSDHDRAQHERVSHQAMLERQRCDVLAAGGLEERLLAVGDLEETFGVDLADVARVDPAVLQHLGRGGRVLVVAEHVARTLDQDLAVLGDLDLDSRKRLAHGQELVLAQRVRADAGRGFGHAPSVEDRYSDRPEEFLYLPSQARPAADEETQSASGQPLAKGGQDKPVRQFVPHAQPWAGRLGVEVPPTDLDRPFEQPAPRGACLADARHDSRIHLFVHTWHAAHHGRLDLG